MVYYTSAGVSNMKVKFKEKFIFRYFLSNKNLPDDSLYVTVDKYICQLAVSWWKNRQLIREATTALPPNRAPADVHEAS